MYRGGDAEGVAQAVCAVGPRSPVGPGGHDAEVAKTVVHRRRKEDTAEAEAGAGADADADTDADTDTEEGGDRGSSSGTRHTLGRQKRKKKGGGRGNAVASEKAGTLRCVAAPDGDRWWRQWWPGH
jgi:hypothetical protein